MPPAAPSSLPEASREGEQPKTRNVASVSSTKATHSNGSIHNTNHSTAEPKTTSLTAAADLIRTLDTAFAEMSTLSASAARDAEDARRNARAASEVARRYTARSYPAEGQVFGSSPSSTPDQMNRASTNKETQLVLATENGGTSKGDDNAGTGKKKRKTYKVVSSSERLAQSHAEDVLALSLELERTKQALESEQRKHDESRSLLTEARCKNTTLEAQVQKLLNDMETQREDHGRKVDGLEQELRRSQHRVEAAEVDAQLALDLATGNAESREQVEEWLQRSLQEVEILREQLQSTGTEIPHAREPSSSKKKNKPTVRFADSPHVYTGEPPEEFTVSPRSQASRSMVAAGRSLLHRATGDAMHEDDQRHTVSLTPEKSAERRKKLRERLSSLDEDVHLFSPPMYSQETSPSVAIRTHGVDMGLASKAIETHYRVVSCLVESGKRLGLSGEWWKSPSKVPVGEMDSEAMAVQYCRSVEATIGTHTKELQELGALCDYLEQKIVSPAKVGTSSNKTATSGKELALVP